MKQFLYPLVIVSGLLIVDGAKADETEKWCVVSKAQAVEIIQTLANQGADVETLSGKQAQDYLQAVRNYTDIPELPGVDVVIATIEGNAAAAFTFKGEFTCGRVIMKWHVHKEAIRAAKGSAI
jgi:hypothetical protein